MRNKTILQRLQALERAKPAGLQVVIYNDNGEEIETTAKEYIEKYRAQGWKWRTVTAGNDAGEVSALLDAVVMDSVTDEKAGLDAVARFNAVFEGIKPTKTAENKGV